MEDFVESGIRYKIDEQIYCNEDRYNQPKEYFKMVASSIAERNDRKAKKSLIDIGCATGEFIYYLQTLFDNIEFVGLDVSEKMLKKASEKMPEVKFENISILDDPYKRLGRRFDFVTMFGTLNIFDDVSTVLKNAYDLLDVGGTLYILSPFNSFPIDVIMRYKPAGESGWKSGWNIFSKAVCESFFSSKNGVAVEWREFNIGFEISCNQEDYMRTWTIHTETNPFQLTNGACQLINFNLLIAKRIV